jgi:beta-lactamase regulating signal transducer with metallopeptidase domain
MDAILPAALMPALLIVAKATALLLLALGLTALMQRASATSRHLVWVASLLALVAIPLLTMWSPVRFAVLPSAWNVAGTVSGGSVLAADAAATPTAAREPSAGLAANSRRIAANGGASPARSGSASATQPNPNPALAVTEINASNPIPILTLIVGAWAAVALGLLIWLAYGVWQVRRIVRNSTPLTDAKWQGTMIDIADRLELDATPRLLRADAVTMPFACGLRTPTIVLPGECESWSDERRAAVLLHELAHIRRRDIVGHTLGRLVCAVYWFHPLAWTAARRLRAESERACDDLALGCGTRASDYAEHLLDIVTSVRNHGTPSVAMAMATRSEFEGRMLAILDPSLARTAPTRFQASTLAGGVMMFAIVTGSAVPKATGPQSRQPESQQAAAASDSAKPSYTHTSARQSTRTDTVVVQRTTTQASAHTDGPLETNLIVQREPVSTEQPTTQPATKRVPAANPKPEVRAIAAIANPAVQGIADIANPAVRIGRVSPADSSARASVLAKILRSDTASSLRRIAAWGLRDFTDNDAALSALLDAARRDASADVREMSAWALSDAADHANVATALAEMLRTEKDQKVREIAIWSLGNGAGGRNTDAIGALTASLTDEDEKVRELAAWGIGNASPRKAPPALVTALGDRNARVRATAAWALFEIRDEDTAPAIESALQKEMDPQAKWSMVRAISVMGERAVAPLQRLIEGSDAAARALAIRALAGHGGDPWPQPRPRPRPFP